ncbi:hypothetical protein ACFQDG_07430 [Natronoarchaeum mannanilyticum]|uniref:hypothetical protein n=1 Tax=Natronoarchaeum mannanilyticum TaxID=926360 RepID=UPI0031DF26C9
MPPSLPSRTEAGTLVAVTLAVVGAWRPWVRKIPVRTADGSLVSTSELVQGLRAGIHGLDMFVVFGALVAVLGTLIARRYDVSPAPFLVAASVLILWAASTMLAEYRSVERYEPELGVYLTLAGGLVLLVLGVARGVKVAVRRRRGERTGPAT